MAQILLLAGISFHFNYSLKIIFERKGGLVNSLVLGCTQSGFPQKFKNNLKFLSLSVAIN